MKPQKSSRVRRRKTAPLKRKPQSFRSQGTLIIWPLGICELLDISPATRHRWERALKLPKRDAYVNGKAVGWQPSTITAMLSGAVPK